MSNKFKGNKNNLVDFHLIHFPFGQNGHENIRKKNKTHNTPVCTMMTTFNSIHKV